MLACARPLCFFWWCGPRGLPLVLTAALLSLASVLCRGLCFRGGDPPRRLQCVPVQEAPSPRLSERCQTEAALQRQRLSAPVPLLAHAAREPSRAQGPPGPCGVGRVFCTPRNRQHGPFWDRHQNGTSEESQLPEISGVVAPLPLPLRGQDPRPVVLAKGVLAVPLQVQSWPGAPVHFRKKHLELVHTQSCTLAVPVPST